MRTILIDDEQDALDVLISYLQKDSQQDVTIIGSARNLTDAGKIIRAEKPDLVLCDIEMEGEAQFATIFDLLTELKNENMPHFDIIFVTAHPHKEYMLEAMEYAVVKFMTKPVNRRELRDAVQKAHNRFEERVNTQRERDILRQQGLPTTALLLGSLALPRIDGKVEMIDLKEIAYIESVTNMGVCHVYTVSKERVVSSLAIGELESLLQSSKHFFRIHQSIIVNLKQLKIYHHSERMLTLKNGERLTASVREAKNLRDLLIFGS